MMTSSDHKPHAIRPPVLHLMVSQLLVASMAIGACVAACALLGGDVSAAIAGGLVVLATIPPVMLLVGMMGPVSVSTYGAVAVGTFGLRTFPALGVGLLLQKLGGLDARAFWLTLLVASVAVLVIETWINIALLRRAAAEGVAA